MLYYHIIIILNQIQYTSFSISNTASNGCIHIDSNCSMWMKNKRLWLRETEQITVWTILTSWYWDWRIDLNDQLMSELMYSSENVFWVSVNGFNTLDFSYLYLISQKQISIMVQSSLSIQIHHIFSFYTLLLVQSFSSVSPSNVQTYQTCC